MAPQDAFVTLENARCQDGILSKRGGTTVLTQMLHGTTPATSAITGLHTHTSLGKSYLLACDTLRCNVFDTFNDTMIDLSDSTDIFSGSLRDLFWYQQIDGKTYMTNGVDGTYMFNGDLFDPDTPAPVTALTLNNGSGVFSGVKMYFYLNDRMIAYDIVDNTGDHKPYRMRYSQTLARGNTPVFTGGGYLDVPTDDTPVTGRRLGRYIYIWYEKSLWAIGPTGDSDIPFRPEILRSDLGSKTRGVCIPFNKGILTVGHKDLIFFDGYETRPLNLPNLNNILTTFSWPSLKFSWGIYDESSQRIYITFTALGSGLPNRILEYSIVEQMWAVHKVNAHTLTMWNDDGLVPWDLADDVYLYDGAIMSEMPISGATHTLGAAGLVRWYPVYGGRDGYIYKLFYGTSDNSVAFDFTALSARLNPFAKEGKRCALGRVAVLVDVSATASFTISLYKNTSSTAYKTQSVSCAGSGDKVWVTMHAGGEIGDFHQIKFSNSLIDNTPVIHATWLEMEPAGSINP